MAASILDLKITDVQLERYAKMIYKSTGIVISPQKKTLLSNRLRRRLKATGIADFDAYFKHLQTLKADDPEWDAFLQEITTHETFLFRDEPNWNWFQNTYLPEISQQAKQGKRPKSLRIWSAACSTGDEAATIAACIAGCLPQFTQWKISIVGTDIGIGAVEKARAAEFGLRAMRLVPDGFKRRFFQKDASGEQWRAKPVLTDMTKFNPHNLLDVLSESPFDLVFVKNVLIYFDTASKKKVLANIRQKMKPQGMLICGAAEGISDLLDGLERVYPWLYRTP